MGVDTKIYLPADAEIEHVQIVMAQLLGLKPRTGTIEKRHGEPSWNYARAPYDASFLWTNDNPGHGRIVFGGRCVDGESHSAFWSYNSDCHPGMNVIIVRSTPLWVAVSTALVDFFGGFVDYQDCDDIDVDYRGPEKPMGANNPNDGQPFHAHQERLMGVKPLTWQHLNDAIKFAAYDECAVTKREYNAWKKAFEATQ